MEHIKMLGWITLAYVASPFGSMPLLNALFELLN